MIQYSDTSIPQATSRWRRVQKSVKSILILCALFSASVCASDVEMEQFKSAWDAAKHGDHDSFRSISEALNDYVLYPYLQYEDYRNRRATVPAAEMAEFLDAAHVSLRHAQEHGSLG